MHPEDWAEENFLRRKRRAPPAPWWVPCTPLFNSCWPDYHSRRLPNALFLKIFFHELCWHPLQSMMLSLCRVSKFQKLSFGSRKCCAKMVLKPGACTAGAPELWLPPRGLALLAPSIEHLGSIEGHFEGFGEKVIQVGRSGPVGRAAELSICCNTCQSRHTY